ncbi:MAG: redoxin domain-containing protein [Saprospiraceae bacterium]|nr:redoxin domain-containing protein [Saprospiraceae bacterium]
MRLVVPLLCCAACIAQPGGYEIQGALKGYQQDSIFLGYYFADKQYLLDTALAENGFFTFSGEDTLQAGAYLVVMPPDNKYFQLMVSEDRHFSFEADMKALEQTIAFEDSKDNTLFYDNIRYIAEKRKEQTSLTDKKDQADALTQREVDAALKGLHEEVTTYQENLIAKHPKTLTAALVKAGFPINIPEYQGDDESVRLKKYHYYKTHYFDNIDLGDARLLRSPQHVLFDKVNYYIEKLTPQHPDSIITTLDFLLSRLEPSEENFKYFLVKFLNDYAQSKIVGMDAVYVHLALNYYAKDRAQWLEEEQLRKIINNARDAAPTLVGKTAPDFVVQRRDSTDINLHSISSPYTVLMFWAHDCHHCKESMPEVNKFYQEYQDKGIEILSVCTKLNADEPACWEFVDEKELTGWINASDKNGGRSFMHSLFNIKKTPKVFVLDKDKKILSKELNAEQLATFFDQILEVDHEGTAN